MLQRNLLHVLIGAIWVCGSNAGRANEVAYLTYLQGTEGKVAPFRVLWNELGESLGRISVDLGTAYEAWLRKLGLSRVLTYDARLQQREYVVRDPQLTRFVNLVANDLVRGPQQVNLPPGVAPVTTGAQVEAATLLITPTPTQLELIARLNVTYLAPQLSGPPVLKELVNGDLVFIGQPERKGAMPKPR
ncbi:MAG TPA: hypothetical protein VGF60_17320 [Xanthobacteraceae bacterium]|jgi:hypothetical protein